VQLKRYAIQVKKKEIEAKIQQQIRQQRENNFLWGKFQFSSENYLFLATQQS